MVQLSGLSHGGALRGYVDISSISIIIIAIISIITSTITTTIITNIIITNGITNSITNSITITNLIIARICCLFRVPACLCACVLMCLHTRIHVDGRTSCCLPSLLAVVRVPCLALSAVQHTDSFCSLPVGHRRHI